jgi:ABC-type branched-subunit amino acid transport system permease subunit
MILLCVTAYALVGAYVAGLVCQRTNSYVDWTVIPLAIVWPVCLMWLISSWVKESAEDHETKKEIAAAEVVAKHNAEMAKWRAAEAEADKMFQEVGTR